jgi:hypothetical protein
LRLLPCSTTLHVLPAMAALLRVLARNARCFPAAIACCSLLSCRKPQLRQMPHSRMHVPSYASCTNRAERSFQQCRSVLRPSQGCRAADGACCNRGWSAREPSRSLTSRIQLYSALQRVATALLSEAQQAWLCHSWSKQPSAPTGASRAQRCKPSHAGRSSPGRRLGR